MRAVCLMVYHKSRSGPLEQSRLRGVFANGAFIRQWCDKFADYPTAQSTKREIKARSGRRRIPAEIRPRARARARCIYGNPTRYTRHRAIQSSDRNFGDTFVRDKLGVCPGARLVSQEIKTCSIETARAPALSAGRERKPRGTELMSG